MLRLFAGMAEKYAGRIILVWLALTIPVAWGITRIEARTSQRDLVPTRYESSRTLQQMDEVFGKIEQSDAVLEGVDMTSFPLASKIMLATEELPSKVGKGRIQSIYTYLDDFIKGAKRESGLDSISRLLRFGEGFPVPSPRDPTLQVSFSQAMEEGIDMMMEDPIFQEMTMDKAGLITEDGKAARIMIVLAPETEAGQHIEDAAVIEDYFQASFAGDPALSGVEVYVTGDPSVARDLRHYILGNTLWLILIAFLFLMTVLYFTFRRVTDVFLCLLVIFLPVVWIFGLMGWLAIPFTLITVALAPVILGINIADVVYMMSRFYEEMHEGREVKAAARHAIVTVGVAVFMAAVATIFGFASFVFSDLPTIQQFGLMGIIGETLGFLLSVTMLPSAMIWRETRRQKREGQYFQQRKRIFARGHSTWLDGLLKFTARTSGAHAPAILVLACGVVVVSFLGAMRLETASDLRNLIPQGLASVQAQHEEERLFGGQQTDFILLSGDILSPEVMQAMDRFEQDLSGESLDESDPLRQQRRRFFTQDGIITLQDTVGAALEGLQGVDLLNLQTPGEVKAAYESVVDDVSTRETLSPDQRTTLISVNSFAARNSDEVEEKRDIIQAVINEDFDLDGLHHELGGMTPLTADLVGNLVPIQIFTSIFALVLSGLVLMFIFRSVYLGLSTLSVLLVSIAVEMGFLAAIGWPLDMMTVLVTSMVIGVGIDFSIHVSWRFREEFGHREEDAQQALEITATSVGRPILAAALSTAGAFMLLTFTEIMPVRRFGGVTAVCLIVSLAATLFLLPALLTLFTRHKQRRAGNPL